MVNNRNLKFHYMKQIHLILFIYSITVKILFFFILEKMLCCAFTVILNPRKERYLQSEKTKKHTWVKGVVRGKELRNVFKIMKTRTVTELWRPTTVYRVMMYGTDWSKSIRFEKKIIEFILLQSWTALEMILSKARYYNTRHTWRG